MKTLLLLLLALFSFDAAAQGLPLVSAIDNAGQSTRYSASIELVALMTLLTVLPSLLLMMTPFVRIIIVMSLLRQALGTGQTPPNQVLVGLALLLLRLLLVLLLALRRLVLLLFLLVGLTLLLRLLLVLLLALRCLILLLLLRALLLVALLLLALTLLLLLLLGLLLLLVGQALLLLRLLLVVILLRALRRRRLLAAIAVLRTFVFLPLAVVLRLHWSVEGQCGGRADCKRSQHAASGIYCCFSHCRFSIKQGGRGITIATRVKHSPPAVCTLANQTTYRAGMLW